MCSVNTFINQNAIELAKLKNVANVAETCASLRFDSGNVPNYNNKLLQYVYNIRYSMAYAYEYKQLYIKLLERAKIQEKIEVVSLGCGSFIDLWALQQVIPKTCRIIYHGVDLVNWERKFNCERKNEATFDQISAAEYMAGCDELTADAYIFPKSISELDEAEMQCICETIRDKRIKKNEVHFLFSMRENSGSLERDLGKTRMLYDTMAAMGMITDDAPEAVIRGENKLVYECDKDFNYTYVKKPYNMLKDLLIKSGAARQGVRTEPMLKNKYMRLQIFTFRKRG